MTEKKMCNSRDPPVFGPFCWITDLVRSIRRRMPELEECAEEPILLHGNFYGLEYFFIFYPNTSTSWVISFQHLQLRAFVRYLKTFFSFFLVQLFFVFLFDAILDNTELSFLLLIIPFFLSRILLSLLIGEYSGY